MRDGKVGASLLAMQGAHDSLEALIASKLAPTFQAGDLRSGLTRGEVLPEQGFQGEPDDVGDDLVAGDVGVETVGEVHLGYAADAF